jgi:signal transduction histidine kinase/CheY-like chemotaxis protein
MSEPELSFIETPAGSPESLAARRSHRRRLNVRLIPALRLMGFSLIAVGVLLHNRFLLGDVDWDRFLPFVLSTSLYLAASWILLALYYSPESRWDLGLVFLVLDLFFWTYALYVSGGEKSLLFLILTARVSDQAQVGFRRALWFAHLTTLCYLLMLAYIAVVDQRPLSWAYGLTVTVFLYGANLYVAFSARPADRLRQRNRTAVRYARELISELGRRARELDEARHAAEAANDVKSRFLANTSHELRTPLAAVLGANRLLLSSPLTPQQKDWVTAANAAAKNLLGSIQDVIDFSALEKGLAEPETAPTDLRLVAGTALSLVQQEAVRKNLSLRSEIDPDIPTLLRTDAKRLRQVLVKLLSNGIKFTDQGKVLLRLQRLGPDSVNISVEDTGIGIPDPLRQAIFAPFTQADATASRRYPGTGLGLAICQQVVASLGSRLEVASREGSGTVFWFSLTHLDRQRTKALSPKEAFEGRVLLVEDNEINRLLTQHQLQFLGLEVEAAADGPTALKLLEQEAFDLVLMDIQMPGMDGFEVTRRLRKRERGAAHTPVVALTAHALPSDRERCMQAGMDDHMAKPASPEALSAVLGRWLNRRPSSAVEPPALGPADADPERAWDAPEALVPEGPPAAEEPALDTKTLSILGGMGQRRGRNLVKEMGEIFLREGPRRLSDLRQALEEKDSRQARHVAHSLRGSGSSLGALPLAALCRRLEDQLTDQPEAPTQSLVQDIEHEMGRVQEALQAAGAKGED